MSGQITTSSISSLLYPNLKEIFGNAYDQFEVKYPKIFTERTSNKATELYQEVAPLSYFQPKPQGSPINLDYTGQGLQTALTNIAYAQGFDVTHEAMEDDLYDYINSLPKQLGISAKKSKEIVGANILINAFDSSAENLGADGQPLCSENHLVSLTNATWANRPTVGSSLSLTSLQAANIGISIYPDAKGTRALCRPKELVVSRFNDYNALQFKHSTYSPQNSNNAINPFIMSDMAPEELIVWDFLPSTSNAWFFLTDNDGLIYQNREDIRFLEETLPRQMTRQFMGYYRCAFGWSDPRAIWGNPGV